MALLAQRCNQEGGEEDGQPQRQSLLVEEALEESQSRPADIWILGTRSLSTMMAKF